MYMVSTILTIHVFFFLWILCVCIVQFDFLIDLNDCIQYRGNVDDDDFKLPNLNANGAPTEGGCLHPLLKARI